ncbi:MAG: anti-sigma regulatory factor [Deltaproteobacteria bacterium]|nr:anti-sigma regulatory factor [Deltaproteobacteria bacterium]MBW2663401.1 anti-sigma regulatory factor [Deltaproteobacteria bacterium]
MKTKKMAILCEEDILLVRQFVRSMAADMMFRLVDQTRLVTAVSELTRNALQYAGAGEIRIKAVKRGEKKGLKIVALDKGPGIDDIEKAMTMGFTTSKGLGAGLPGTRQLVDEFDIQSSGNNTTATIIMWKR